MKNTYEVQQQSASEDDINVLLVDDDPTFLNLSARYFQKYGDKIQLTTIESPEEVLEKIENQEIECVISDYKMPEMNGIELLRRVRSKRPDIPFIILTSEGNEEIASEAIAEGVTDYIRKKGDLNQYRLVIKRIENAVLKKRIETERREEKEEYEHALTALNRVNQELIEADSREKIAQLVLQASVDILGISGVAVHFYDDSKNALVPAANSSYVKNVFGDIQMLDLEKESLTGKAYLDNETIMVDDISQTEIAYTHNTPLNSGLWIPVGRHGVIEYVSEEISNFTINDERLGELLASSAETALNRLEKEEEFENTITELQSASSTILNVQTAKEVSQQIVETAEKALDLSGVVVYRYNKENDTLFPDAESSEAGFMRPEFPTIPADDSTLTGHQYKTQEQAVLDDINNSENLDRTAYDETKMRSGMFMPVGRHGIIVIGSTKKGAFNNRTARLIEILAETAKTAYDRIERKHTLEESRQKRRTLVENFPNGAVGIFDKELRYQIVGGETADEVYESAKEIEGEHIEEIYEGETLEKMRTSFRDALNGEKSEIEIEVEGLALKLNVVPLRDDNDEVFAGLAMSQDVTERKRREEELEMYEEMIKAVEDSVYLVDPDGKLRWINDKGLEKLGYDRDEVIGVHSTKLIPEEEFELLQKKTEEIKENRKPDARMEINVKGKDGTTYPVEVNFTPFKFPDGQTGRVGVARDMTQQKERQKELELFETVVENMRDGVYVINNKGRFEYVNRAYCEMTGFKEEEILGEPATKIVSEEIAEKARERIENLKPGESAVIDAEMKTADDRTVIGESKFVPLITGENTERGKVGVVRDVTEQKMLEKELRRAQQDSEAMTQSMIEAVEDYAIFRLDTEGRVASWNKGARNLKGYTEEEITGEHFSKFYTEEDRKNEVPERNLEKARKNGKTRDRGWRVRKDGTQFWAEVVINAIKDENGEVTGFTKVTKDMTERRRKEEEMQSRLEEFGSLASHDLKNPLEIAKGYLDLAQDTKSEEDLNQVAESLEQMENIIEDLRVIAMKQEDLKKGKLSLDEVLSEAYTIAGDEESDYSVEDVEIEGSRTSLLRLFGNLISNSIEHNLEPVHIRAGPTENGFYYEDDGEGIDDELKEKITERGYTTSESGHGLGLYIVQRIADLHGWEIEVRDSEKGGARFEFHI